MILARGIDSQALSHCGGSAANDYAGSYGVLLPNLDNTETPLHNSNMQNIHCLEPPWGYQRCIAIHSSKILYCRHAALDDAIPESPSTCGSMA